MWGNRPIPLIRWYLDYEHENMPVDVYQIFKEEFCKELVNNPEGVTLPLNMGWLKIVCNKRPSAVTHSQNPEKKKLYQANHHSSGWVFKAQWYSTPVGQHEDITLRPFFNSDMYAWKSGKFLKKTLFDKIIANEWHEFHERYASFTSPRHKENKAASRKKMKENRIAREATYSQTDQEEQVVQP